MRLSVMQAKRKKGLFRLHFETFFSAVMLLSVMPKFDNLYVQNLPTCFGHIHLIKFPFLGCISHWILYLVMQGI